MKKKTILAALLILTLGATLLTGCTQPRASGDPGASLAETGTLILRVNPEISVEYNKEGLVTKIAGLNDDGTAIVSEYDDYIGKDCKTVVRDLVNKIGEAGYFIEDVDGNSRSITIQIEPGSVLPEDDFLNLIADDVRSAVSEMNAKSQVMHIGHSDYDERYAKENAPSGYITRDKAAEIAMAHAGVSASDTIFDDREFDFERGVAIYELEFVSGGKEYEYDIDATTGSVLRYFHGDSGYGVSNYDSHYASSDYGDTDYGPNNDGVTDYDSQYGVSDYGDTDYGPNNDGVTDYDSQYGVSDYGDTDYGPNNDGVTDYNSGYGSSNYDSGYTSYDSGYGNS